ncbi:hypothetical protein DY000_02014938 [Brassica cretica]|uniref:BHLH domain-containing protein n=1 Tax=Brassica cretica TaxID=69181 RepID=A0ABQ7CPK7_BRACR|nr:hypothetical protein DY000_02014938 [Brassica cretica]
MLKHIILKVPFVHDNTKNKRLPREELNHVVAKRRRREKLNERFITLRSLVPFVTKMDKVSILGDTIEYVNHLSKRIHELESTHHEPNQKRMRIDRPMLLHRSSEVAPFLGCQERLTRWETMGVDMLLLDFQVTTMPATVNVNRLATHRPNTSPDLTYAACYNTSLILRSLCLFHYCESDLNFAIVTLGLDLLLIGPSMFSGKLNKATNYGRGKRT